MDWNSPLGTMVCISLEFVQIKTRNQIRVFYIGYLNAFYIQFEIKLIEAAEILMRIGETLLKGNFNYAFCIMKKNVA
jgi:hypothetical protein